jgi:serine phosphatase RsbU (regulator of sigma subunit)
VVVRYRPAATHALVGGDFYDVVALDDGATLLVVGDVTGHAVEATAAMSQLRSAVRTLAFDHPHSPASILLRTDRALSGLGFPSLATALVARIAHLPADGGTAPAGPGRHVLQWSSAGHPPPVLLTADGRVRLLATAPERLLGVDAGAVRSDHAVQLRPGDTVILYTDGLIEHGRTGINEGTARLLRAVTALAGRPLEQLCDELLDGLVTGRADDDVALLAVRCDADQAARPPAQL